MPFCKQKNNLSRHKVRNVSTSFLHRRPASNTTCLNIPLVCTIHSTFLYSQQKLASSKLKWRRQILLSKQQMTGPALSCKMSTCPNLSHFDIESLKNQFPRTIKPRLVMTKFVFYSAQQVLSSRNRQHKKWDLIRNGTLCTTTSI